MDFKEILPIIALRRFDAICLHNEYLHKNKEFQQQILSWATDMLAEAREQWGGTHSTTIDAIVTEYRKTQAQKRGKARDNKYAPSREYFKQVQKERFLEYKKAGLILKSGEFLRWFLENRTEDIVIPYKKSNQNHKLLQLAQENNREFKKYL